MLMPTISNHAAYIIGIINDIMFLQDFFIYSK